MSRRIRKRTRNDNANVKVRAIGKRKRTDISRQAEDADSFAENTLTDAILATPYNLTSLSSIFEQSNVLRQCVEAMTTNITRFGYRPIATDEDTPMDPEEKKILQSFIDAPNIEETLVGVQAKKTTDYERYGFGFIEVIRDIKKRPSLLRHAKAYNIRLMRKSGDAVEVTTKVVRGGRRSTITEHKRFRRYMQIIGGKKVYFKEFGDPRNMDYRNGRYSSKSNRVRKEHRATELLHERQYSEDNYGLPRWISQLPSILGSREAEEVNMRYFEDNTVPPMIMAVAGGRLTRQSFQDLNTLLKAQGVGKDRQNQIMLIEAIPETTGLDEKGTVSLQIEKLADARPSDGLFKEYDESNMSKVRSSFRLPPVVIGLSQDVTFATANVSAYLAETQVFLPERQTHDEFMNKNFVNHPSGLGLTTVKLESKGPSVTNPDQIVKTMTAVNVMGGVTPRKAIEVINETMQLSLEQYPAKGETGYADWMDMPMALSQKIMARSTQQTGEGDHEDGEQGQKDQDLKDREENGETGVGENAVEHGQE